MHDDATHNKLPSPNPVMVGGLPGLLVVLLGVLGKPPGPKFGRREAPYSGRAWVRGRLTVGGREGRGGRWNRTELCELCKVGGITGYTYN